jgi:pyruvate formate lyase activating enzyme
MQQLTGIIFDIRHFTMHDGPGVRTTVFLKGCPLRCLWCHNPEGRSPAIEPTKYTIREKGGAVKVVEHMLGKEYTVEGLMDVMMQEATVMKSSGGGITFSGGEPLLQHDFLLEILKRCKEEGVHTALDTNGYADVEVVEGIIPYTDLFLFDIKHANRDKHLDFTSVSTKKIFENLKLILSAGGTVWVRIPVVPGFNFSRADMGEMIKMLLEMPSGIEKVQLIPYRRSGLAKYRPNGLPNGLTDIPSVNPSRLTPFKRMFKRAGFHTEVL